MRRIQVIPSVIRMNGVSGRFVGVRNHELNAAQAAF
jgi:hypothetical protein